MPRPVLWQAYRRLRYNRYMRPGFDFISSRSLRLTAMMLNLRHQQCLFLVGHMRSGSSLLSAILTANDEINGYGEAKVVYRDRNDSRTLSGKIAIVQMINRQRPIRRSRFIFDKVLHPYLLASTDTLHDPRTRIIFLYREPEASMRSIVASLGWTIEDAANHLIKQYGLMEKLAHELAGENNSVVLDYEEVIENSDAVLEKLSCWLELGHPLEPAYDPHRIAKIAGSGDPSDRLSAGKILQSRRSHAVDLTDAPMDEINQRYRHAVCALREHIPGWNDLTPQRSPQGSSRP